MTGRVVLTSSGLDGGAPELEGKLGQFRFFTALDKLVVIGVGLLFDKWGGGCPVGNDLTSIYLGIDDAVEDIKEEFFRGILSDGIVGASPILFPFTSPNALVAQATIAYGIRGEAIVMPGGSFENAVGYARECIEGGFTDMAAAGEVRKQGRAGYCLDMLLIEAEESAVRRGARMFPIQGANERI